MKQVFNYGIAVVILLVGVIWMFTIAHETIHKKICVDFGGTPTNVKFNSIECRNFQPAITQERYDQMNGLQTLNEITGYPLMILIASIILSIGIHGMMGLKG